MSKTARKPLVCGRQVTDKVLLLPIKVILNEANEKYPPNRTLAVLIMREIMIRLLSSRFLRVFHPAASETGSV